MINVWNSVNSALRIVVNVMRLHGKPTLNQLKRWSQLRFEHDSTTIRHAATSYDTLQGLRERMNMSILSETRRVS